MKKVIIVLACVAMLFAVFACTPTKTEESKDQAPKEVISEHAASDVAEQGFDYYDAAVTYQEAVELLGPIPKIDEELNIGYVCKAFENEFWRMQKEGSIFGAQQMNDAGFKLNMDVRAAQGETDEQGQLAVLEDMINKGYSGILCSPISDGNLVSGIENGLKNDTTFTVVNDSFMEQIEVTVGAWHLQAAQLAAEWVNEKIGGEGQVAIIMGLPKAAPARTRTEGFENWFADNNPNVEVVAIQSADWDRTKAKEVADIWMIQYPELKAIYANNDTMAMGALEAVKAANSDCLVVGTDGVSEARESIKNGELAATVDSFPYYMSQIGLEMLIRQLAGQDVPKVVYSPQAVIDSTNVNKDAAEIIGWTGYQFAE